MAVFRDQQVPGSKVTLRTFLQRLLRLPAPTAGDRCSVMAEAFGHRLRRWKRLRRGGDFSGRVGVLVSPWVETAVPYYSLEWALRLDQAGFSVEVLWDPEDVIDSPHAEAERSAIEATLARLPGRIRVRELPRHISRRFEGDRELLDTVLFENETRRANREPAEWQVPDSERFFDHAQRVLEMARA